ncbi:carboxypeptidase regulatory-like domain-containing protein [Paenibacillus sp. GYB004]|uniref:carboxypeptidase regulatory-like domain-containing protein n=1 Tax=Paenibacillus sp. GYB004 TaxID=2994393 RepID=UPI002F96DA86
MLKIKIKVKHLVLSVLAIAVALPLLTEVALPYWNLYYARQQAAAGNIRGVQGIMEALDGSLFTEKQKQKLIRETMIEGAIAPERMRASNYDLYVGPGHTQSHLPNRTELFRTEEKVPYLEYYVDQASIDGYWSQAVKHLAYVYERQGQPEEAIRTLEEAERRLTAKNFAYVRQTLVFRQAELLAASGQVEEADRVLAEFAYRLQEGGTNGSGEIARMRARVWIDAGQSRQALERFSAELEEANSLPAASANRQVFIHQLTMLQELLQKEEQRLEAGRTIVSGTLRRSDGTPIVNAGVFLREESIANRSVTEQDPYQTTTDASGQYTFYGVTPGSYQLYLGMNFDQISGWTWPIGNDEWTIIDGQPNVSLPVTLYPLLELFSPVNQQTLSGPDIEFEWERVEGAAYYNVNVGIGFKNGSGSTTLQTHVENNRLTIPAERLYDQVFGLSYETERDWASADPSGLLGFSNPDNRFFWSVEAFGADGRMLTKSSGYRLDDDSIGNLPFFYMKQRTLTEADRLVQVSHYEEALSKYKEVLENDPNDVHALRMVIRLLQSKALVMKDESIQDAVVPYLKRMLEVHPEAVYASALAEYYAGKRDWTEYNATIGLYDRLRRSPLSSYEQSVRGKTLTQQSRFDEALTYFEQAMRQDGSHRFVGLYLAVEIYTDRSMEDALRIAKAYPEHFVGPPQRDWARLVEAMGEEAASSSQALTYMDELRKKLEWVFQGDEERLRSWIAGTRQDGMKEFVRAVMAVR